MRRVLHIGLAALSVLLLAELFARVLEPQLITSSRLDRVGSWPHPEIEAKYEQIRAYRERGWTADVVFAGSSAVAHGFDSQLFEDLTGERSYNAGLPGMSMRSTIRWLLDVVQPSLKPQTIVLGVLSFELNDRGKNPADRYRKFIDSPGLRAERVHKPSVLERGEEWISTRSAFFRHRRQLRDPATLLHLILGETPQWETANEAAQDIGPRGERVYDVSQTVYKETPDDQAIWRDGSLNDFVIGGRELSALKRLRHELGRRGVSLVIIEMPYTTDFAAAHQQGASDLDGFHRTLSSFVREQDTPYLDGNEFFHSTKPFRDMAHLGPKGRDQFTRILAARWPLP